ncbi:hypothetical protein PR048_020959 [Dryococelus australis]|uniref:Uncharacterized protein n=1 Tax=Dryococelus australis TaxID=614101 RepID=A0ABQ9GWW3_9NEOP|nr:hypothetical protein PR048_020959 [Dryococelus australis]
MNAQRTGRLTCWALKRLEYTFDIKYFSVKSHAQIDSLSKNAVEKGLDDKDEEKSVDLLMFSLPGCNMAKAQRDNPELTPLIMEFENPSGS